ncbi:uncharacterized protein LOC142024560 isoform X2 [Carettochelys insculpta]|uniref:uncharacterized protein LOC142024560 isoform X2 n=1 Tax=Carettochelys insculpta TaxID=44489 RepID=UPI003EBCF19C
MEETQLLEPEDEERHLSGTGDPAGPVGRLHLLGSKYGPERDFWIYPGQTVVGRLPSCGVCLPAPSVSKAHAVIEVSSPDGPHLLYDRGSLNGTRRRRAVLVPHVRYSLTHGDILLFGDVGCQYFLLPPGGADPDDSLEVPPTQPLACPALAIEGTPAPSKRVGYGAVLAQDSEDEEELWGEGRLLHLPGSNGSDSSAEAGARSQATFSSPSANVVPESDEEGGETPHTLRPTPRYKGNPSSPQNGATAGLGGKDPESALAAGCWDLGPDHTQVTSGPPGQRPASPPGSLALGGPVNGRPGQAGSEPEVVDHRGEMPAIEVGSDTDEEEEEEAANRDVQRRRQRAVPGGRDAAGPEVPDGHPEGHGLAGNRDSETEVGQAGVNSDVGCPKTHWAMAEVGSDTDVEEEEVGCPGVAQKIHQPITEVGSDTDEEAAAAAENAKVMGSRQPLLPAGREASVEKAENPDVAQKTHQAVAEVGSDTDVEEAAVGDPDVHRPHQALAEVQSDTDVEEEVGCPDVAQKVHQPITEVGSDTDVEEEEVGCPDVAQKTHQPMTEVGSDTDVEEAAVQNPDVAQKDAGAAFAGGRGADVGRLVGKPLMAQTGRELADPGDSDTDAEAAGRSPDVGRQQDPGADPGDSDTDVEESGGSPAVAVDVGSNTNAEAAGRSPDVGRQRDPGTDPRDSDTDVEAACGVKSAQAPRPAGGPAPQSCTSPEAPDVVRTERPPWGLAQPGDESETDAEGEYGAGLGRARLPAWVPGSPSPSWCLAPREDADFALQATQCYLPKEALCSGAKATSAPQAADSGSRLEEEATQTFLLRPPPPVRGSVMSPPAGPALHTPVCSSSEKEEDSEEDPCVADATQSFCEEPGCRSAPPASPEEEEEETQLLLPPPPPEGALSQQQPAVPGQSSGGRLPLGALALPAARPGPEAPGRTLPAGGAGLEPTQGESQPMRLALSASPRPGLALQGEGGRAGAEPRGSSSGHRAQGLSEQGGLEAGGRLEAPATARDLGTEPRTTRDLEVNAEPQPTRDPEAEAETAGNPEPQPTRDPEAEPQPAGDPEAEAQPARDPEAKAEAQRMGDLEAQPQPAGAQAKDAGQVPEAQPSPPAPVRRRSLRSAAPPAPPLPAVGPERRSQRRRAEPGSSQGELPVAPTKPTVAIPARRARRQLCSLALYLDVSEAEQPGPGKRPRRGPGAQDLSPELGAASQGAPGQAQRSRGAAGAEPVPTAKPSTGPGAPGRAQRSRRAAGAEPVPTAEPSTGPGAPGRAQRSRRAAGAEPVPTAEPSTGPGAGELGASQGRARRSQRAPARELAARRRGGPEPAGAAPGEGAGVAASEPPTALENAECGAGKRREALVPPLRRRSSENKAEGLPARATRRSQGPPGGATSPKVLFTGVIDEAGEQVVAALGGALAQSVFDCTHLVTDRVRRTVKFLCALARGVPIVTLDWLDKSGRSSCFLAPSSFLVRDMEREKDFHFSLAQSLKRARRGALLQGYEIHVTPSVKPEPEHMKDIIQCSGGAFLPHMPRAYKDKCIIISCPEDLPRCRPALSAGLPVASAELILTGVLRQALDLAAHRLDSLPAPAPPSAAPTRGSKRKGVSALAPAPTSSAKRRR